MFQLARRPQLKAAPPQSPLPHKLKPPTPPASPMPSLFTGSPKQKKGCSDCDAAKKPTLERPPSDTQMRRGSPGEDPAERQADALGKRIGDDLSGTDGVGHGPLPKSVQAVAESHLGVSLEGTDIDAGSGGQRKAKDESALAVTEGRNIAFGEGQLSTSSAEGRALLGHELVHVGQQVRASQSSRQRQPRPTKPVIELVTFPPESAASLARRGYSPVTADKRFWKRGDGSEVRVLSTSAVPNKPDWFSGSLDAWLAYVAHSPPKPANWVGDLDSWLQWAYTAPGEVPITQGVAGIEGTYGAAEILEQYGSSTSAKDRARVVRLRMAVLERCVARFPGTSRWIPPGQPGSNFKCCNELVDACFGTEGDVLLGNPECPVARCMPQ